MHQHAEALVLLGGLLKCEAGVPPDAEFRDRISDGFVEATIQRTELIEGERSIALNREVCDGLAKVAVVVNYLVYGKPQLHEFLPVRSGAQAHLGQITRITASGTGDAEALANITIDLCFQRSRHLIQK